MKEFIMTADEVLRKKPDQSRPYVAGYKKGDPAAAEGLVKKDNSPLTRIYRYGTSGKVRPYVNLKDLNRGEGKEKPAVEVGIKISF